MQLDLFNGGISDTDTLVAQGQFQYAENIEVMESPEYIRLSADGEEVTDFLTMSNYNNDYFGTTTGGMIKNSSGTTLYTDPSAEDIVLITKFKDYLIWFIDDSSTSYKLGAIELTDASMSTAWSSSDYVYPVQDGASDMEFEKLTSDSKIGTLIFAVDVLIVYSGSKIYKVEEVSGTRTSEEILHMDSEIKGLTQQGTYLYIYTEDGYKYIWNGSSDKTQGWINLKSEVSHVAEDSGFDYVFLGEDLYLSQGLTPPELLKRKLIGYTPSEFYKINFSYGSDTNLNRLSAGEKGIHYVMVSNNSSSNNEILQFGKYHNSTDFIFNVITTQIDGDDLTNVNYGLYGGRFVVYYSGGYGSNSGTYKFDYLDPSSYQTTGFLQTHKEYYGDKNMKKKVLRGELLCSDVDSNNYINVYYSIDGADWVLWKKVDEMPDNKRKKLLDLSKEFYGIQVKFELVGDGTTSPKIYGFKLTPMGIDGK